MKGNLCPALGRWGKAENSFCICRFCYLQLKVIFMHISHSGWQIRVQEELGHKQVWAPKNWCFQIVVLEKNLESALDFKEIKPINPKGNQPLIFIGRTVAEAEAPIVWPPDAKSWLIGRDPDAGKDWGQEEKRVTEDEWLHSITDYGHEFEQTLGNSER